MENYSKGKVSKCSRGSVDYTLHKCFIWFTDQFERVFVKFKPNNFSESFQKDIKTRIILKKIDNFLFRHHKFSPWQRCCSRKAHSRKSGLLLQDPAEYHSPWSISFFSQLGLIIPSLIFHSTLVISLCCSSYHTLWYKTPSTFFVSPKCMQTWLFLFPGSLPPSFSLLPPLFFFSSSSSLCPSFHPTLFLSATMLAFYCL